VDFHSILVGWELGANGFAVDAGFDRRHEEVAEMTIRPSFLGVWGWFWSFWPIGESALSTTWIRRLGDSVLPVA
jgi:hypothetical protein